MMQSRLIVTLCIVGCAMTVQAKPHVGIERNLQDPHEAVPTHLLQRAVYNKLKYNIHSYSQDDVVVLRERLSDFIIAVEERLFIGFVDVEKEKSLRADVKRLSFATLAEFAEYQHQKILRILSLSDINDLRITLNEFLDDTTPEIKRYLDSIWPTVFERPSVKVVNTKPFEPVTEDSSLKDLLSAGIHKLSELRDSVWAYKKSELADAIIKIIMRADEELIKNNHKDILDQMLARTPYDALSELSIRQLGEEVGYRAEVLLKNVWEDKVVGVKSALVDFINIVEKKTFELE